MTDQNLGTTPPPPDPESRPEPAAEPAPAPTPEPAPAPAAEPAASALDETRAHPAEPVTPPVEPAEPGTSAPAASVAREGGTFGGGAGSTPRSSAGRWAIAVGGIALVAVVTVAIIGLAGSRAKPAIGLGYMPADTIQYSEYRLDLPGDQRQKLAGFLSAFPGFADQSNIDAKLNELLDRLVAGVSGDQQTYTRDIQPWFGGQISIGSSGLGLADFTQQPGPLSYVGLGGDSLLVVSITDPAKATAWARAVAGERVTESQHAGVTIYALEVEGAPFSFAVTDKVLLGGSDAAVRAAIDSKGEGKLAEDAEFKAAFAIAERDYATFSFVEYRAVLQSMIDVMSGGAGIPNTAIDDELLSMIPAWQASTGRFEGDALVGESVYPSVDIGFEAKNRRSTLSGHAPPATIAYLESHDVGPALLALLERFRQMPELREGFGQVDGAMGLVGGFDGVFGWWGDVAVAISKGTDGAIGGGLLIQPSDGAAARRTFETLRSFIVLGGGQAGLELRDEQHGEATVTILDFSAAAGPAGLPEGVTAEIAYTVTDDVVAIGYGAAWVRSVLDAGPGPSLADDARFRDLVNRVGGENIGLAFVDVNAIRELIEPLAREAVPADAWALYERDIKPYVVHLDAFVSGVRRDGGRDISPAVFTVRK